MLSRALLLTFSLAIFLLPPITPAAINTAIVNSDEELYSDDASDYDYDTEDWKSAEEGLDEYIYDSREDLPDPDYDEIPVATGAEKYKEELQGVLGKREKDGH